MSKSATTKDELKSPLHKIVPALAEAAKRGAKKTADFMMTGER